MKIRNMEPTYIPTKGVEVRGRLVSMELSYALVQASIFYAVEPMPDEVWAFYVKEEAVPTLEAMHAVAIEAAKERCSTCRADAEGNEPYNCQIYKTTDSCRFI